MKTEELANTLEQIGQLLEALQFGSLEIQIHEGRIAQIERRERFRPAHPTKGGHPTRLFAGIDRTTADRQPGAHP